MMRNVHFNMIMMERKFQQNNIMVKYVMVKLFTLQKLWIQIRWMKLLFVLLT